MESSGQQKGAKRTSLLGPAIGAREILSVWECVRVCTAIACTMLLKKQKHNIQMEKLTVSIAKQTCMYVNGPTEFMKCSETF